MFHDIRRTSQKIHRRLCLIASLVYRRRRPLPRFQYLELESPLVDPPVSPKVDDGNWQSIPWGAYWSRFNADFVLRTRFQIPSDWSTGGPIALHLPIGKAGDFSHPEALAYIDGLPHAACDRHHQEIILPPCYYDTAPHLLALHGWAGSLNNDQQAQLLMRECALVQIDQPTRDFLALARVALGVADCLDENTRARAHLYTALDEAFKTLDTHEPFDDRFYESVPLAAALLREGVSRAGPPLGAEITAAGHAHIDVAWLWTLAQTRSKAGRTFHNVIRLMEQFPATPRIHCGTVEAFFHKLEGEVGERLPTWNGELYLENHRGTYTTGFPLAKAWRTNLLEENQERLDCDENWVTVFIKPYQILTLRIVRRETSNVKRQGLRITHYASHLCPSALSKIPSCTEGHKCGSWRRCMISWPVALK